MFNFLYQYLDGEVEYYMGESNRKSIKSNFEILFTHLLKWKYQPIRRGTSWLNTIREQRRRILAAIEKKPSFKSSLDLFMNKAYSIAISEAAKETNLPKDTFPVECPWTYEEIMDFNFFPD